MAPLDELSALDLPRLWSAIESAAELAQLAVYVARVDTQPPRIVYASPRAQALIGRTQEELVGRPPWIILRSEDWPMVQALTARPPGAPPVAFTPVLARPDGEQIPVELTATRIHGAKGEIFVFGYFRDVREERRTRAALEASERRFQRVLEGAPDGVAILRRGVVVYVNPRAAELLGVSSVEEALGRPIAEFLPAEDAALAAERIAFMFRSGEDPAPHEYRTLRVPGRIVEIRSIGFDWEGQPAVLAFARDVTERNAIQSKLVDADRLAALGTLAAGVAHEINNPLTYAQLSVERALAQLAEGELSSERARELREALGDVAHGVARIASITRGLRTFARPSDDPVGPVELGAVVERALRMVDNDLRHRAQLVRRLDAVSPVLGKAAPLEQVVVNLLLNALQSFVPGRAPVVRVTVSQRDAATVTLEVEDNGRGIAEAIRGRIFDPFFTTRPVGEGMGLGLAVSRTIVEGAGGTIGFTTVEGVGTTFTVSLRAHHGVVPKPARGRVEPGASRRVLLVDDEPLVRETIQRLLATRHEVLAVGSGAAALAALQGGDYDVILCDVMMPGMNGRELHRRVAELRPGLERRMIFMSGGTFTDELEGFLADRASRCLSKPFELAELFEAIEAMVRST